jgi:hypothetical protein
MSAGTSARRPETRTQTPCRTNSGVSARIAWLSSENSPVTSSSERAQFSRLNA